jgi:hypothetical protein
MDNPVRAFAYPSLSGIRGAVYGRRFLGFELNCNTRVCVKEMQPIKAVLEPGQKH